MSTTQINVPDIGADNAEVIEVLVSVGEEISEDQSIIVLESDKASLEVPAPSAGRITSIAVKVGDELTEGDLIAEVEVAGAEAAEEPADSAAQAAAQSSLETPVSAEPAAATSTTTTSVIAYLVPDIGSDESEVIEISVAVGDSISEGDTICVAESDKASLEIPAEADGVVVSLAIAVGDTVGQGHALIELEVTQTSIVEPAAAVSASTTETASSPTAEAPAAVSNDPVEKAYAVPDIGADSAEVIELSVSVGDEISEGDTICVAESDKASLELPAEASGKILSLSVAVGDKVSQGDALISIEVVEAAPVAAAPAPAQSASAPSSAAPSAQSQPQKAAQPKATAPVGAGGKVYAGPAVRKLARELGVDLTKVPSTGTRGRIVKEDLHNYVKNALKGGGSGSAEGVPAAPVVDWSKFGSIRTEPMTKIQRVTADNMSRCWLNVPHVTQFDNADVTDAEEYRQGLKAEGETRGVKMSPVAFLVKLAAKALRENPKFNSSLHQDGKTLVFRDYCHIGLAVDTPAGLMVPVIRDADTKDIWELAADIIALATKAKEGKLKPNEMQGACFTISSLGAIGGTGFTPIVPSPQVGILGVSKTDIQPVWDGSTFVPRKLMPLALSYDHRAVNGGDAGRFLTYMVEQFSDIDNLS